MCLKRLNYLQRKFSCVWFVVAECELVKLLLVGLVVDCVVPDIVVYINCYVCMCVYCQMSR